MQLWKKVQLVEKRRMRSKSAPKKFSREEAEKYFGLRAKHEALKLVLARGLPHWVVESKGRGARAKPPELIEAQEEYMQS